MSWALEQRDIVDATARYVLLVLANYADKNGRGAFPSSSSISEDTGLSIRTVKYKLDHLLEIGVIRLGNQAIAGAYIDRHDRRPTVYDLCVERGATAAPGSERGANDDATGCSSRQNGVQTTTERGAGAAPNPSINHQGTIKEPKASVADAPGAVRFDRFWTLYPRKVGKSAAEKSWRKLKVTDDLFDLMAKALAAWTVSTDWTKDGGQFIPHASTWLNGKRWEDELPQPAGHAPFASRRPASGPDFNDTSWADDLGGL